MDGLREPMDMNSIRDATNMTGLSDRQVVSPKNRQTTRVPSVAELPKVIGAIDNRLAALQKGLASIELQRDEREVDAIERLADSVDVMHKDMRDGMHVMNVLLSQLVAFQTYMFDTSTLSEDAEAILADTMSHARESD